MADKLDILISWLDAIDLANKEDKITSILLFSDGSGRILQEEKIIGDFITLDEAFEQLETIKLKL